MAPRKQPEEQPIEPHVFATAEEIDRGITKLTRRLEDLERLDVSTAIAQHTGADDTAISNVRETIREIFGSNSPEFREHQHIRMWAGALYMGMSQHEVVRATEAGKALVKGVLTGLVDRLKEKRGDLAESPSSPATYFARLNLHPRIAEVANDLFLDGYHWEAVFAAAKALVNYVKDRSGRHDLDGTSLMRTVFSKNAPALQFNDLSAQTDLDEQEGMMHLFEGAVMAIRNPGGHDFPEGPQQRAMEYISFLSLLAYRVQEAKKQARPKWGLTHVQANYRMKLTRLRPSVFLGTDSQAAPGTVDRARLGLQLMRGR